MLLHVGFCIAFGSLRLFENAFRLDSQLVELCLVTCGFFGISSFLINLCHNCKGRSTLERMLGCIQPKLR